MEHSINKVVSENNWMLSLYSEDTIKRIIRQSQIGNL